MQQSTGNVKCTYEEIEIIDLISALKSLPFINDHSFFIPTNMTVNPPGDGVDNLIDWSLRDIYEAINLDLQGKDPKRNATNAVINARRSLACLVDWYLLRDGFSYCKNPPRNSEEKTNILLKRGIIDELTSKVLKRIIDIRNITEHEFKPVNLEKAENIVELIRRTKDSIFLNSNPAASSIVYGEFKHRYSNNGPGKEITYEFFGWEKAAFITALYDIDPWMGVLIPESRFKAYIRRTLYKNISTEELLQILVILNSRKGYYTEASGLRYKNTSPRWSGYPENDLIKLLKNAGLVD